MFLSSHVKTSFTTFCLCNFSFVLVTIVLLGMGVNVINGDKITKIGLEIPTDVYQERANAYETAREVANFGLTGIMCPRSEAKRAPLSLILDLGDGENALTKKGLERLKEAEAIFTGQAEWKDR